MPRHYLGLLLAFAAGSAAAQSHCYGSTTNYSCNDVHSGNSYNVSKFGGNTQVNGYNAQTGSTWNQNSTHVGNTTYVNGNTNGRAWSQTIQASPGMTTYFGTDSKGVYRSKTCTAYGCN
jgi:hypothetical protein